MNKNKIFSESNLKFQFDNNWEVIAFDKTNYYKILSGYGLKGVDFLGLLHHETPVLIEVKNYKWRVQSPKAPDIKDILGDDPQLIDMFIGKIEDTLSAVRIIYKLLNRKWSYRLLKKVNTWLGTAMYLRSDWQFWTQLYENIYIHNNRPHYVLWLRTEKDYPEFSEAQILALKATLRKEIDWHFEESKPKFYIADIANNPYRDSLHVEA